MKIAFIGDTHLGYRRFQEDAYNQAKAALEDANRKADLIVLAGDVFDVKIPRLEVIERAIKLFKSIETPIIAIHGNHERRGKDMINPVELIASAGYITHVHNNTYKIEKEGVKANILGIGNIPSGYVREGIRGSIEKNQPIEGYFNILVIHQSINELIVGEEELSLDEINEMPFDLVVNGHIHKKYFKLNGKLILPGSTVITQLKPGEVESRGYVLYDVAKKDYEFVEIPCRKFEIIVLNFENAGIEEINSKIKETVQKLDKEQITRIILKGTLKEGINFQDVEKINQENLFIDNKMNIRTLKEKLDELKKSREESLSIREFAIKEIDEKLKDKISIDTKELFEKLQKSADDAENYLDEKINQDE